MRHNPNIMDIEPYPLEAGPLLLEHRYIGLVLGVAHEGLAADRLAV